MPLKATTPAEYIASLSEDRQAMIKAVRATIRKNLQKPFKEGMQYGGIGYFLPLSEYPDGYHCDPEQPLPLATLINQKGHLGLYLFCVYTTPELEKWFRAAWKASGKKLDMGKSCVRVKSLDAIPLDVLAELFQRVNADDYVKTYEAATVNVRSKKKKKKSTTKKKSAAKTKTTKKKKSTSKKK